MIRLITLLALWLTFIHATAQIELLSSEHSSFHYRSWTRFGQMENVTANQSGDNSEILTPFKKIFQQIKATNKSL
jgi:hypothetical protein